MRSSLIFRSKRLLALITFLAGATAACDKAPLLAPTNSSISVSANTRTLPLGGSTEITAYVIESAGTPVQNGTTVRFTTNLGRVDPVEVETRNGQATTTFFAGDLSGVAEVRAQSGGAGAGGSTSTPTTPATPGAPATPTTTAGNAVQITIGAAAVETVTVSANPSTVSTNGGTVEVIALVMGAGGRAVSGVPVTFSANRGTLSSSTALSDANGQARVQLTTNADTTVTASAGGKVSTTGATVTAQAGPSVTLTCTSSVSANCSPLNVGDVAVFTAARGATTSNIRSATLDFGDGSPVIDLGNLSGSVGASHQYLMPGSYTVRLIATDVNGEVSTSTLILIVQEAASVVLNLSNPTSRRIDATATLTGCTAQRYDWNFGNDAVTQTLSTTTNQASSNYNAGGTKTVQLTVRCVDGRTTQTSAQLTLPVNP
jgi:PKD repeat protein